MDNSIINLQKKWPKGGNISDNSGTVLDFQVLAAPDWAKLSTANDIDYTSYS